MSWLSRLFPWPAKHERRKAVEDARSEHRASRATATQSRVVRQQINRLAEANHYAGLIEEQIMRGHGGT